VIVDTRLKKSEFFSPASATHKVFFGLVHSCRMYF